MTTRRSADQRLPLWFRITALGVENQQRTTVGNPVAVFAHGELRRRLDPYDLGLHASSVTRAIRSAIAYGLLERGSNTQNLYLVQGSMTTLLGPRR